MTRSSGEQREDYRFTPTIVHDTFVTLCNFKSIFIVMNTLSVWRVIIQLFFWKHKSRKTFLSKVGDENLIIQNPCPFYKKISDTQIRNIRGLSLETVSLYNNKFKNLFYLTRTGDINYMWYSEVTHLCDNILIDFLIIPVSHTNASALKHAMRRCFFISGCYFWSQKCFSNSFHPIYWYLSQKIDFIWIVF